MAERWREHRYRKLYPMTHEQFLDEPCVTVDWALAFAGLEAELESEAIKKAKRG